MTTEGGPFFNLKAVVQQTGLKPDTLRAWERRYGLPNPERSGGRHRLYSQRDIDTVKWLQARQAEGLSISRAVELWRQMEADGQDPLDALPIAALAQPVAVPQVAGETVSWLRQEWVASCLAYDEQRAEQVAAQAFALYPPETVVAEVLQKGVVLIGEGWYRGEVTVQQEHFCSALAIRRLESLIMAAPPPSRQGQILAACPPHEEHVFGLLLLTFMLRRRGWPVVYLGANVPTERLETTVAATRPQLVILAAQRLRTAATLLEMASLLQRESVPLAYGGLIFSLQPALRERIPGHFLGDHLEQAPRIVEGMMVTPGLAPTAVSTPDSHRQAREHFAERQGFIEAQLVRLTGSLGIAPKYVTLANRELGRNIVAALTLGDMDFLGTDTDFLGTDMYWIRGLLDNYELPADALQGYLAGYRQAAREYLDERGQPILAWLDGLLAT